MRKLTRIGLVAFLLITCVGCDQVSKNLVREHLAVGYSQSFLGDAFRLTHAENTGAFLSVGASLPEGVRVAVFQFGVSLIVVALLCYALFSRQLGTWSVAGFALLAASGLGNLIDRILYDGHVTDFLNLGIGSLRTGIFNVADVLGVAGFFLLMLKRSPASAPTSQE
jgi:signal peptidase II